MRPRNSDPLPITITLFILPSIMALRHMAYAGHAAGNMALSGSPAGKAVLDGERGQIGLLEIALLYGEGGYHLIVGKRYVSCACGLGYIRVLHLGGVFVDVSDLAGRFYPGDRSPGRLITACGAEPVPTLWRPNMFRLISGLYAIVLE